jgi:adenine nucleotide transporter 17
VHQAVLDIIKREGVAGLYSGLNSSLLGIAVTNGYHPLLNDVEKSKLRGFSWQGVLLFLRALSWHYTQVEARQQRVKYLRVYPDWHGCWYALYYKGRTGSLLTTLRRLGSATTIISNPIWVIQTSQAVQTLDGSNSDPSSSNAVVRKLGFWEIMQTIVAKDGIG